jgi:hypothetical protein
VGWDPPGVDRAGLGLDLDNLIGVIRRRALLLDGGRAREDAALAAHPAGSPSSPQQSTEHDPDVEAVTVRREGARWVGQPSVVGSSLT